MVKACESCGTEFEAKGRTRFCGGVECTRARQRVWTRDSEQGVSTVPDDVVALAGPVEAATRKVFDDAGVTDTPIAQATLVLARRLDTGKSEAGSSLAATAREFKALLAEATAEANQADDPVEVLRQGREERRLHAVK